MNTLLLPNRPYTIPHDQERAGQRDYIRVDVATSHGPSWVWPALTLLAFVTGFVLGIAA